MPLEIYADTVCPWCYIGKRRLERALRLAEAAGRRDAVPAARDIRWRPFLLNPGMPPGGMDRRAYLAWKFGGAGRAGFVADRILQEARDDSIPFAFDRIARTPNTVDSHRLIALAQSRGDAEPIVEALFAAYFCEGRDIGKREELIAIGAACGLDAAEIRAHLHSEAGLAEVVAANERARTLGIHSVPCFVLDEREALSGAQPPEVFLRLFDFARSRAVSGTT